MYKFLVCRDLREIKFSSDKDEEELIPGCVIEMKEDELLGDWVRFAITKGYIKAISL